MCVEYWQRDGLVGELSAAESRSFANHGLENLVDFHFAEGLLVQASGQCHNNPFAFRSYEFIVKKFENSGSILGAFISQKTDLEFKRLFLEFFSDVDFLVEDKLM